MQTAVQSDRPVSLGSVTLATPRRRAGGGKGRGTRGWMVTISLLPTLLVASGNEMVRLECATPPVVFLETTHTAVFSLYSVCGPAGVFCHIWSDQRGEGGVLEQLCVSTETLSDPPQHKSVCYSHTSSIREHEYTNFTSSFLSCSWLYSATVGIHVHSNRCSRSRFVMCF